MEHVRLIVAIALSLLVFVAWDLLFVDRQPVHPPEKSPVETTRQRSQETSRTETAPETDTPPDTPSAEMPASLQSFKAITVDTGLYQAEISEQGASLKGFTLKNHRENPEPDAPLKSLVSRKNTTGTALVGLDADPQGAEMNFSTDFDDQTLKVGDVPETLSFYWQSKKGVIIEKRFVFYPDSYKIGMIVKVTNQSGQTFDQPLFVSMTEPPPDEGKRFTFQGPFIYVDKNLEEIKVKDLDEKNTYSGNIQWTGFEDHYFMTALVPEDPMQTNVRFNADAQDNLLYATYEQSTEPIAPGNQQEYVYSLFLGPKQISVLSEFGSDLQEVVDFGFFSFIARPCLWLMNAIHDNVIANYGVAIILLTLLFKTIFWPLGNKSYKSMAEMKKLQPLMSDIRKKYKDDRQKMNEEVMRLYKTYKVNPLSGCLPMVVQIPVFIAFYRMLYDAIELRHTPFLLWINDLSAPDRLFNFDITIPFMAPPYGIPVLTIIMGATMFLQQKLSPPPGDPSQAKFMMLMPLIFTVIFINFPSGLVLYWLTNNVVSIGQQYYITRKTLAGGN